MVTPFAVKAESHWATTVSADFGLQQGPCTELQGSIRSSTYSLKETGVGYGAVTFPIPVKAQYEKISGCAQVCGATHSKTNLRRSRLQGKIVGLRNMPC